MNRMRWCATVCNSIGNGLFPTWFSIGSFSSADNRIQSKRNMSAWLRFSAHEQSELCFSFSFFKFLSLSHNDERMGKKHTHTFEKINIEINSRLVCAFYWVSYSVCGSSNSSDQPATTTQNPTQWHNGKVYDGQIIVELMWFKLFWLCLLRKLEQSSVNGCSTTREKKNFSRWA